MKIVDSSYILFDEFTQHVFDKLPKPFFTLKDGLVNEYAPGIIDDLYDVWYYYINSPTMRYVNNYYEYKKYDPLVYKKNMLKALDNLCKLEEERIIKTTREMMAELSDISEDMEILDNDFNKYNIHFVWVTEPGCCKICKQYDGRVVDIKHRFDTHWNCRCHLEQHTDVISPDGEVINTIVKIL